MRRFLPLALLASLAGCASSPGLQSRMNAYDGDSAQTLVSRLGKPSQQFAASGAQYYAYVQEQKNINPAPNVLRGYPGYLGYSGPDWGEFSGAFYSSDVAPDAGTQRCETTFKLVGGRVVGVTVRGNDCG